MSAREIALVVTLGLSSLCATSLPAASGDKVRLETPGASIDVIDRSKLLKAGDAQIKVKPGKKADCVRLKAGNAQLGKGKIKNGKCKS